jgi:hypothetical protein
MFASTAMIIVAIRSKESLNSISLLSFGTKIANSVKANKEKINILDTRGKEANKPPTNIHNAINAGSIYLITVIVLRFLGILHISLTGQPIE